MMKASNLYPSKDSQSSKKQTNKYFCKYYAVRLTKEPCWSAGNSRAGRVGVKLWSREEDSDQIRMGCEMGGRGVFQAGDKAHKAQCITVLE